jgi:hypothetical protein
MVMATKVKAAPKAAAATPTQKYRTCMQPVVADVAAKEDWYKRSFVTQRTVGKGVTNVLAATETDLTLAKAFFEAALPTLSGKAKQEVLNTLNKGWIDPAFLTVYREVTSKVAVAKPVVTEPKAARKPSQNPRVLANRMVIARAKAIADRSQP